MAANHGRFDSPSPADRDIDSVSALSTTATAVSETLQDGSIGPFEIVPVFVRRCLHIGTERDWLKQRCKEGIEELWCAGDPAAACAQFSPGYFDAVLVTGMPGRPKRLKDWFISLPGESPPQVDPISAYKCLQGFLRT